MEKTVYIRELNCEACERLVRKVAGKYGVAVSQVDFQKKEAKVSGSDEAISRLMADLQGKGYSASLERLPTKGRSSERFLNYLKGSVFGGEGFSSESKAFEVTLYSFVLLSALTLALALTKILPVPLFYALLSAYAVSHLAGASWHVLSYRNYFTHMNGMMVGMGIGMSAGFLVGALVGATNGMFVGSVAGMAAGMLLGTYLGSCCGVMGVLEGVMGGLMAGTMGAMLSVMMQFDNLDTFLVLLFASFAAILAGIGYMVYKENQGQQAQFPPMALFVAAAAVTQTIVLLVFAFAPHSSGVVISR